MVICICSRMSEPLDQTFGEYKPEEFIDLALQRSKTFTDRENTWRYHQEWLSDNNVEMADMDPTKFVSFLQMMARMARTPSRLRMNAWISHLSFYYQRCGVPNLQMCLPELKSAQALWNLNMGKTMIKWPRLNTLKG